jgi:CO/xanthine dehydrogenase FAD-binding subunit
MIPEIQYIKPTSLNEVLQALANYGNEARLLAGGTDIIPGFHIHSRRFRDVRTLIDISGLPELTTIEEREGALHIGAATTFSSLMRHPLVQKNYPLLARSAAQIGSVQIRNRATVAGNFVNNAPCADSVPPLLVYDARIVVQSKTESKELPLQDFLLKPYRTQLRADEIVEKIILPPLPKGMRGDFYKLGRRRSVAISRITLAVLAHMQDGIIREIRIASGAVTPIGKRFPQLEKMATGQKADSDFLKELAIKLGEEVLNVTGLRWSTAYKLPVLQQTFYQTLKRICQ